MWTTPSTSSTMITITTTPIMPTPPFLEFMEPPRDMGLAGRTATLCREPELLHPNAILTGSHHQPHAIPGAKPCNRTAAGVDPTFTRVCRPGRDLVIPGMFRNARGRVQMRPSDTT